MNKIGDMIANWTTGDTGGFLTIQAALGLCDGFLRCVLLFYHSKSIPFVNFHFHSFLITYFLPYIKLPASLVKSA